MAKKSNNTIRERKIGKQVIEKKPGMDPKLKSTIWTVITIVVLIIFFIINNTRTEPEEGQYPPNYVPAQSNSVK
jgi:putative exporter of polyketide antibiotics